jgi:hypothetical protein
MHWRNSAWQARRNRVCRTSASSVTPIAAEKQTINTTYKHTPPFLKTGSKRIDSHARACRWRARL